MVASHIRTSHRLERTGRKGDKHHHHIGCCQAQKLQSHAKFHSSGTVLVHNTKSALVPGTKELGKAPKDKRAALKQGWPRWVLSSLVHDALQTCHVTLITLLVGTQVELRLPLHLLSLRHVPTSLYKQDMVTWNRCKGKTGQLMLCV